MIVACAEAKATTGGLALLYFPRTAWWHGACPKCEDILCPLAFPVLNSGYAAVVFALCRNGYCDVDRLTCPGASDGGVLRVTDSS
jgi:hypothetical protein